MANQTFDEEQKQKSLKKNFSIAAMIAALGLGYGAGMKHDENKEVLTGEATLNQKITYNAEELANFKENLNYLTIYDSNLNLIKYTISSEFEQVLKIVELEIINPKTRDKKNLDQKALQDFKNSLKNTAKEFTSIKRRYSSLLNSPIEEDKKEDIRLRVKEIDIFLEKFQSYVTKIGEILGHKYTDFELLNSKQHILK